MSNDFKIKFKYDLSKDKDYIKRNPKKDKIIKFELGPKSATIFSMRVWHSQSRSDNSSGAQFDCKELRKVGWIVDTEEDDKIELPNYE